MVKSCGECLYLDWNNKEKWTSKDRYWCRERRKYVETTDRACSYAMEDKSKKNDTGYQRFGCYITTMVVDILGYEDNCDLLQTLRSWRENFLRVNVEYLPILVQYDIVGPLISRYILKEQNNRLQCQRIVDYFLIPCVDEIKRGNNVEAVEIYLNMVNHLNDTYGLPSIPISTLANCNFDAMDSEMFQNLGKGRVRILPEQLQLSE